MTYGTNYRAPLPFGRYHMCNAQFYSFDETFCVINCFKLLIAMTFAGPPFSTLQSP